MKSGYSPPAIRVPSASSALCPVSQVSLHFAPIFSAMICWISLSSLISEPGTPKNAVNSLISFLPPSSAPALPASPAAFCPAPDACSLLSPHHASNDAAMTAVIKSAVTFCLFITLPPFVLLLCISHLYFTFFVPFVHLINNIKKGDKV